jgi:hypothetical protein
MVTAGAVSGEINIAMMCQRSVNVCKQIGKKSEYKKTPTKNDLKTLRKSYETTLKIELTTTSK